MLFINMIQAQMLLFLKISLTIAKDINVSKFIIKKVFILNNSNL